MVDETGVGLWSMRTQMGGREGGQERGRGGKREGGKGERKRGRVRGRRRWVGRKLR